MESHRRPYNKASSKRILFEELVKMIGKNCDYKFAIIDYEVDDELKSIAQEAGIDLSGYKHVIETTGTSHSENRHGDSSNDRTPISIEDYLLIPFIIKCRDKVEISNKNSRSHKNKTFIYRKAIGEQYIYVEKSGLAGTKVLHSKHYTKGQ